MNETSGNNWASGLSFDNLHPQVAKLPMIRALLEGGIYESHPSEPSLFTMHENGLNHYWMEWLNFVLARGIEHGNAFETDPRWQPNDDYIRRIASALYVWLRRKVHSPDWVLPKIPPMLTTTNGAYISMAWVLDTANRDHMPLFEAVRLGHSLLRS